MSAFLKALPSGLLCSRSKYAVVRSVLWCGPHMPHFKRSQLVIVFTTLSRAASAAAQQQLLKPRRKGAHLSCIREVLLSTCTLNVRGFENAGLEEVLRCCLANAWKPRGKKLCSRGIYLDISR